MNYGYARVSKDDQEMARQVSALEHSGCEVVITEHGSGAKKRPKLEELMKGLQAGDCLTVCKLDRFGRSTIDLLNKLEELKRKQVEFKSLGDMFDTATPNGKLLFTVIAAIAEYERALTIERVMDGLRQARAEGKILGRPKGVIDLTIVSEINRLLDEGKHRLAIQKELGMGKNKYYKYLNHKLDNAIVC